MKKSRFTTPLVVGREDAVSNGDFLDEVLRLLVDDSADGVRWDKVATIKNALTDGTYSVSVEDLAEKIISARRAIPQVLFSWHDTIRIPRQDLGAIATLVDKMLYRKLAREELALQGGLVKKQMMDGAEEGLRRRAGLSKARSVSLRGKKEGSPAGQAVDLFSLDIKKVERDHPSTQALRLFARSSEYQRTC